MLLDVWLVLPMITLDHGDPASLAREGADSIIAALE